MSEMYEQTMDVKTASAGRVNADKAHRYCESDARHAAWQIHGREVRASNHNRKRSYNMKVMLP